MRRRSKVRRGYAPGWMVRCPVCGRRKAAADVGVIRIGAASISKRIPGYCSACRSIRWLRMYKEKSRHDRLWSELASYVAAGTMTVDVAEEILRVADDEQRGSEIAALIAEGMDPAEGLRLLSA